MHGQLHQQPLEFDNLAPSIKQDILKVVHHTEDVICIQRGTHAVGKQDLWHSGLTTTRLQVHYH